MFFQITKVRILKEFYASFLDTFNFLVALVLIWAIITKILVQKILIFTIISNYPFGILLLLIHLSFLTGIHEIEWELLIHGLAEFDSSVGSLVWIHICQIVR